MKESAKGAIMEITTGIKIKIAFLHQAITWPGSAGSEKTISKAKIPKMTNLSIIPQGLLIEVGENRCLVPHTNVVNYVLE